jgi:ureidoglycolate lyase
MRTIGIQRLTFDAFSKYGAFAALLEPAGPMIGGAPVSFFRDLLQQDLGSTTTVSYSVCVVEHRDWVIEGMEHHNHTCESFVSLDGDYVLYVAPACPEEKPPSDSIEAFMVPKCTMIVMRPGVWHLAGFSNDRKTVHLLCALPERAYANDCVVVDFPEKERIRVLNEMR